MSGTTALSPESRRDSQSDVALRYWSDAAKHRLSMYTGTQSRDALSRAQLAIDDELEALRIVAADFRSQRNALSIVGALPAEILSRIFALHAFQQPPGELLWEDDDSEEPPSLAQMELGWITVTHVSRRWRSVALADPSLWTRIAFRLGNRWVDEMLTRAGPAPLIYERLYDHKSSHMSPDREVLTLSTHLPRIKTLILSDKDTGLMSPILHEVLTSPAPHLSHLELSCPPASPLSLSPPFLRDNASRLTHLRLHNVALPYGPWSWDLLRTLKINAVTRFKPAPVDVPADAHLTFDFPTETILFSALASMPALERLELLECLPQRHSSPDGSPPKPPLHLPLLRTIFLSGSASECVNFLELTKMPGLCSLGVDVRPEMNRDVEPLPDIHALMAHVSSHLEQAQDPLLRLSAQVSSISRFLELRGWSSEPSVPEIEPSLFLSISFPRRGFNTAELQTEQLRVFQHIPATSVQLLQLDTPQVNWGVDQWQAIGSIFKSAEEVCVVLSSMSSATFVNTLRSEASVTPSDQASSEVGSPCYAFFPSLYTLEIEGMHFASQQWGDTSSSSDLPYKLLRALEHRKSVGSGPRVLRLRKCTGIDTRTVARMKEIVPILDWDRFKEPHAEVMDIWA
ncbi:hypothetical protein PENSPDRAFT_36721 [Peniophora sp. CONT]|nr:hypothetical protein PENSPDRAFT_36721 [Peniophora sp. CONT]